MRVHINKQQKETTKNQTEECERDPPVGGNLAKNSPCDRTELTIQTIFTLAIIINFYTFIPTLHVAALIILFKCLTNFPKERKLEEQVNRVNQERKRTPKTKKAHGGLEEEKKEKDKGNNMETLKMHRQPSTHYVNRDIHT